MNKQEKIEKDSIEDLGLLLKELKENKQVIRLLNKIQELEQRINMLEQMNNQSKYISTVYPVTGGSGITYSINTKSTTF